MNKFYAAFCRYQLQRYNFELQKHEKPEETELLQWDFAAPCSALWENHYNQIKSQYGSELNQ